MTNSTTSSVELIPRKVLLGNPDTEEEFLKSRSSIPGKISGWSS